MVEGTLGNVVYGESAHDGVSGHAILSETCIDVSLAHPLEGEFSRGVQV